MYAWGDNEFGQLGIGTHKLHSRPMPVPTLEGRRLGGLSAGGKHTCCWTVDGVALSFGFGIHGQLGHGDLESLATPKVIARLGYAALVHPYPHVLTTFPCI